MAMGAPYYEHDISGALTTASPETAPKAATASSAMLAPDILEALTADLTPALAELRAARHDKTSAVLSLADRTDDLAEIEAAAARISAGADTVAVLGTGGSSLGGQTLTALADYGFGPRAGKPRLVFFDNVDPAKFDAFFNTANPAHTRFIAVSKSGGTAETLLQTLTCMQWIEDTLGKNALATAFTVLTEPKPSPISRIAAANAMPTLEHDPNVGGRYAALSSVGLLPAAIAGLDIHAIRQGAQAGLTASLERPANESPAALGAALNIGLANTQNVGATVLMPYQDALQPFAFWFRQLWAESLGKDGQGTLPVNALGAVDQHSQLQLYLAGPNNKLFTLILADVDGHGRAPTPADDPDLLYLQGKRLGGLLDAEQRATAETLVNNGRPTRIIRISKPDERTVGALMAHYMLETILAARLLAVDPFDQPAVEEGKLLAQRYLQTGVGL